MAIDNPVSDVRRATAHTHTDNLDVFSSVISSAFDMDLDASLVKETSERHTQPLLNDLAVRDDEILLDESEDEPDEGDLVESTARPRSTRISATKQATGNEDAFQSYLRDIRGLGLLTHAEEIDLAQRAAAGDELSRRKLIESNLRLVLEFP
jgi:RNA polymerase primary sigma factor